MDSIQLAQLRDIAIEYLSAGTIAPGQGAALI